MALSIKTDEADALARELAAATNESLTQAVTVALRERLDRVHAARRPALHDALIRLVDDYAAARVDDSRAPDEIIGYDDDGAPA